MKPTAFRYARPGTLADTLDLLAASGGEAMLLAGGQSLLPLLNLRQLRPAILVDLALVPDLQVLARDGDELVIGAGVRQRIAETSPIVREACPLLPRALRYVGHVQTRTRGTVGGSLAFAHPAAELAGVAVALEATLAASSRRGRRVIAAHDFFLGPHTTALERDEVLTEVRLPVRPGWKYAFVEVGRSSGDFGVVGVAAALQLSAAERIAEARLVAIGATGTPLRLRAAEEAARGPLGPAGPARIAAAAVEDAEGSSRYHRRLVGTLVSRAVAEAAA